MRMKINQFKHGDTLLIHIPWEWNKIETYSGACIRFFINMWNKLTNEPHCRFNHAESIVEIDNILYAFGAIKNGFKQRYLEEILEKKIPENYLILTPRFNYDKELYKEQAIKWKDIKYDYAGTFFHQLIRLTSFELIWIGKKGEKANKKLYCTEAAKGLYYYAGKEDYCDFPKCDPEDLFNSLEFDKKLAI